MIGRSTLHRNVRTFNVGRILDLEPLDDPFDVPRGFSVERYLRNAWHLIPEPGPDQEICVRFGPRVAQNVAEVTWQYVCKCVLSERWKSFSGRRSPACSRTELRRREAGWGAPGGERPVRNESELDSAGCLGEPAAKGRSPDRATGSPSR